MPNLQSIKEVQYTYTKNRQTSTLQLECPISNLFYTRLCPLRKPASKEEVAPDLSNSLLCCFTDHMSPYRMLQILVWYSGKVHLEEMAFQESQHFHQSMFDH